MPREDSPSNALPAAIGRFRVLHQIGTGALGPVFRGVDPETGAAVAIKQLRVSGSIDRARQIADQLSALVNRLPAHLALIRMIDAGLDGEMPYVVTTFASGDSLDAALEEYGPAAIVDALPRLRTIAEALDDAAAEELWHGALHPRDIIVSGQETQLTGVGVAQALERARVPLPVRHSYTPPEVLEGRPSSPAADQYALAAIAHEWLFGRRVDPANGGIDVPALPGTDAGILEDAFTVALAAETTGRFPSCLAFVEALQHSLNATAASRASATDTSDILAVPLAAPLNAEPVNVEPRVDLSLEDLRLEADPVREPQTRLLSAASQTRTYGIGALAVTLCGGIVIGAVATYFVGAALRQGEAPGREYTDAPVAIARESTPPSSAPPAVRTDVPTTKNPSTPANPVSTDAAPAARDSTTARLLVRTSPAGATVTVDGVPRGTTPLAVRDLELGTRSVVITRDGYAPAERRITLTADRPSRSIEMSLTPLAAATRATPTRPASAAPSATGTLVVESRPTGAAVSVDGQPSGATPLTLSAVAPGRHTVRIELAGYRPWTTTIDVKAGERARVAASLAGAQEQE